MVIKLHARNESTELLLKFQDCLCP